MARYKAQYVGFGQWKIFDSWMGKFLTEIFDFESEVDQEVDNLTAKSGGL
jgi:hypothetical protein